MKLGNRKINNLDTKEVLTELTGSLSNSEIDNAKKVIERLNQAPKINSMLSKRKTK